MGVTLGWTSSRFFRCRRVIIIVLVVIFLCFLLVTNVALQDISATTISLEAVHDPTGYGTGATSNSTARILLVSAMFPITKSKHSTEDYAYWISRFLRPINTDVYFFTPQSFAATVRVARGDQPITIDTSYASPFDIPPLKGLEEKYRQMHKQDREKFRHSPELYAIWNAKPFLLDAAVRALAEKRQEYDYVFWNDAGSFRGDHQYADWPDAQRVQQIWKTGSELTGAQKEDLLFFPLVGLPGAKTKYWKEDMGPIDYEVSEGSFFGGSPRVIAWWKRAFYTYHNHYLSLGLFVGKDQTLINALFLLFPERIITVWYGDPDAPARSGLLPFFDEGYLGACGSDWFYYQFWLADRSTREKMRDLWVERSSWANWEWWKERQKCRLTDVAALKDLLQRQFGRNWTPPSRKVVVPEIDS